MSHINLEDFVNNRRKCTISFWDKKRVFEEPTIEEILKVKDKTDWTELAKWMLKEWNIDEFEEICNKMTAESKSALFQQILDWVGLSWRLQKASQIAN